MKRRVFAITTHPGCEPHYVEAPSLHDALMRLYGTTRLNYAALSWREVPKNAASGENT